MISADPSTSLRSDLQIRPAVAGDYQQIADLIYYDANLHRHLDWRTPLEWLGRSPYWVLELKGQILAALACPPDPEPIAWIRLFVFAPQLQADTAWAQLWASVQHELARRGGATVAAIAMQSWFDALLNGNGFTLAHHIVLLEWTGQPAKPSLAPPGITFRRMSSGDLARVVEVDAAAFEPLWQNSLLSLSKAFSQAAYASVAEDAARMVGYQLSTWSPQGAHLARLAVRPEAQGKGLGEALVRDLIIRMQNSGATRITVNTQENNASSLALYQKLGFHRTGEQYPVYTFQVEQA